MVKRIATILAVLLVMRPMTAAQKPKPAPPKKQVLTEEEKEIVRNREMLENLDLLKDFEKFRFFALFAGDSETEEGKQAPKPEKEKNEKKAK